MTRKPSHFDASGAAHMVDVGAKPETERVAVATCIVKLAAATAKVVAAGRAGKGDVLGTARLAGLQALKRTAELIPLCHPIRVVASTLDLRIVGREVRIRATVRAIDRTGVEMEAMTAVTIAALTVYDMCKGMDRSIEITAVRLEHKSGGKSGAWDRG